MPLPPFLRTDETGQRYLLGVPFGVGAITSEEVRQRNFDPENPALFIPRNAGLGWDLNLGALAVRCGFIRPDDSIPDLEEYIPQSTHTALENGPVVLTAINTVLALSIYRHRGPVASHWGKKWRPDRFSTSTKALALPMAFSYATALWHRLETQRENSGPTVMASANALSLQCLILGVLGAMHQSTHSPDKPAWPLLAGQVALPLVMIGTCVGTVKSALNNLQRVLESERKNVIGS